MNRADFQALGDKHKAIESNFQPKNLASSSPVVARLDGRAFHTFTKGLKAPYDQFFSLCMYETAKYLIEQTQASVAYRQSDEITLVWTNDVVGRNMFFGGNVVKLISVLASMATAKFNQQVALWIPRNADLLPAFDARVMQYSTLEQAAENVQWRQADAIRNSITMLALTHFSAAELRFVGTAAKLAMLQLNGHPWEAMPTEFKQGTFLRRQPVLKELNFEELSHIPAAHRPTGPVMRSEICDFEILQSSSLAQFTAALFYRETNTLKLVG